jgi:TPR repeat protein
VVRHRKAAEQELAEAANTLGNHYKTGAGTSQDDREAVRWFRIAAEGGDPAGQLNLGAVHANGRGVGQEYGEAGRRPTRT